MTDQASPGGRICMFHIGRSGSTVVADQLRQHPGLSWGGELIDPRRGPFDRAGALARLDEAIAEAKGLPFGFETKFYHLRQAGLDAAAMLDCLDARGFGRFVTVRRRNLLRKVVSSVLARRTGQWHRRVGSGAAPELRRIRLKVDAVRLDQSVAPLHAIIDGYEADFRDIGRLLAGRPVLDLVFEDDIQPDPAVAYRRVAAFLGLSEHPAEVRLLPTTPWPLSKIVKNLPEVRAHLAGTPHAWMAEE